MIHFFIGVTEFTSRLGIPIFGMFGNFDGIRQYRNPLMLNKQKVEIYLFLYSIMAIGFGYHSFVQIMIQFQSLSLKSKTNPMM